MSLINIGEILILLFRYFTWKVQIFKRSFKEKLKCFLKKLIEEWVQNTKLQENTENYMLGIFKTAKYCLLKTV